MIPSDVYIVRFHEAKAALLDWVKNQEKEFPEAVCRAVLRVFIPDPEGENRKICVQRLIIGCLPSISETEAKKLTQKLHQLIDYDLILEKKKRMGILSYVKVAKSQEHFNQWASGYLKTGKQSDMITDSCPSVGNHTKVYILDEKGIIIDQAVICPLCWKFCEYDQRIE